jgi:membrane protease YdiL (CAAX protease family)
MVLANDDPAPSLGFGADGKDKITENRRQITYDLLGVLTVVFVTDVLVADYFVQFYLPTILLWAFLPLFVELTLRRGTIRNLGFLRTNYRRSLPLYLVLALCWTLLASGVAGALGANASSAQVAYLSSLQLIFFHPAFVEELNFRGFVQTRLEHLVPVRSAIIVQAALFALYHVPAALPTSQLGFSPGGLLYPVIVFPFGIVQGIIYLRTRNLFVTMAIHGSLVSSFLLLSAIMM